MPKIRIKETDNTGSLTLPSAEHAVYVPGFSTTSARIPAIVYSERGSLREAATTGKQSYDMTCLAYKIADYLNYNLGMQVIYEGLPTGTSSLPSTADSWKDLIANKDRLPVRFITTGTLYDNETISAAIACAASRGDCAALVNIDELGTTIPDDPYYTLLASKPGNWDTEYTAYFIKQDKHEAVTFTVNTETHSVTPQFEVAKYCLKNGTDYIVLLEKPSDWDDQDSGVSERYFTNEVEYIQVPSSETVPTFRKNTYYVQHQKTQIINYDATAIHNLFDNLVAQNGEYAAGFTPFFETQVADLKLNPADSAAQVIPASYGYVFAYARMIQTYPEWIATAGSVNGIISELSAPLHYYSDADAQILQGRTSDPENLDDIQAGVAVNPILDEYPFGVIIWGARTLRDNAADELKATSFLNIRNLITSIKKVLRKAARKFTFSQNTDTLWYNFRSMIEPTLESMKNGNGIAGYLIEQLPTTAKARLKAKITIIPIEPVEDFDLEIVLTDSITVNE